MNKIFITSFLAICISMSSCSSDEKTYNQPKQELYSKLNEDLAAYNATFWNANNIPHTRSFWKKLRGFLLADAGGALIGSAFGGWGALFGAVFSSAVGGPALAEHEMTSQTATTCPVIPPTSDNTQTVPISDPYSAEVLSDDNEIAAPTSSQVAVNCYATVTSSGIGYEHNLILSRIEETHQNIYNEAKSSEVMADLIVTEMGKCSYAIPETEKNILIQKVNSIVLKSKTDSATELITLLKNTWPEYSDELSVIDDFTINIGNITNNTALMKAYLDGYLQVIERSNLTNSQKEVLKSSLEVAANSALFWVTE